MIPTDRRPRNFERWVADGRMRSRPMAALYVYEMTTPDGATRCAGWSARSSCATPPTA